MVVWYFKIEFGVFYLDHVQIWNHFISNGLINVVQPRLLFLKIHPLHPQIININHKKYAQFIMAKLEMVMSHFGRKNFMQPMRKFKRLSFFLLDLGAGGEGGWYFFAFYVF